jgi:hypothetical protein
VSVAGVDLGFLYSTLEGPHFNDRKLRPDTLTCYRELETCSAAFKFKLNLLRVSWLTSYQVGYEIMNLLDPEN